MSTLSTSKILICIYSCKSDTASLEKLKNSEWYKKYSKYKNIKTLDCTADPNIEGESIINDSKLIVKTEESYDNLSIKTYKIIKTCYDNFDFDFLIKLDATFIENNHAHMGYIWSFENFEKKFLQGKFTSKNYSGSVPIMNNTPESFQRWADGKGLTINPITFMMKCGINKFPEPYYGGKCYSLSRLYCETIIDNEDVFTYGKLYLGGCEDACIGVALNK